jgi:tetratricopeptide (TPR) repeat protein
MQKDRPLNGAEVAITGRLLSMTRPEAVERILAAGGRHVREPGPSTAMVVAGEGSGHLTSDGRITRSMEVFRQLKKDGSFIRLVAEPEFLTLLGADGDLEDFTRLYTAAQVSRIAEVPLSVVRSWTRVGLLPPARVNKRLAWFEFKDIVLARSLSRLTASGVPASRIHRSLSEIARWLPDGERLIGRLEAYARGLRVRLSDGGVAEPSGQRLMEFLPGDRGAGAARAETAVVAPFPVPLSAAEGSGSQWFTLALAAEDQGDLPSAAEAYKRALAEAPDAETWFNLGNVLYEMGNEGEAAEQYLQAIHLEREFAEAWNNLGNALAALKKMEDAVRAYEMALSLEPDYPDPHCNLATILERMQRPAEAFEHRGACLRAFPSEAHLRLLRQESDE